MSCRNFVIIQRNVLFRIKPNSASNKLQYDTVYFDHVKLFFDIGHPFCHILLPYTRNMQNTSGFGCVILYFCCTAIHWTRQSVYIIQDNLCHYGICFQMTTILIFTKRF